MKRKNQKPTKAQWIKMSVVCLLYIAFLIWIRSWWGVIVLPFIFDAYITKKINWTWWKDAENPVTRTVMSWVDAIVFALVAVYSAANTAPKANPLRLWASCVMVILSASLSYEME